MGSRGGELITSGGGGEEVGEGVNVTESVFRGWVGKGYN